MKGIKVNREDKYIKGVFSSFFAQKVLAKNFSGQLFM
jgi:hypothetical protein